MSDIGKSYVIWVERSGSLATRELRSVVGIGLDGTVTELGIAPKGLVATASRSSVYDQSSGGWLHFVTSGRRGYSNVFYSNDFNSTRIQLCSSVAGKILDAAYLPEANRLLVLSWYGSMLASNPQRRLYIYACGRDSDEPIFESPWKGRIISVDVRTKSVCFVRSSGSKLLVGTLRIDTQDETLVAEGDLPRISRNGSMFTYYESGAVHVLAKTESGFRQIRDIRVGSPNDIAIDCNCEFIVCVYREKFRPEGYAIVVYGARTGERVFEGHPGRVFSPRIQRLID